METVNHSISLSVSKQVAWDALADFGNPHRYFKGIVDAHLMTDVMSGVGMIRHCDLPKMMGMRQYIDEKITDWKEGEEFTYIVTETAAPIKNGIATWRVTGDENRSIVSVDIKYEPKGVMGYMMKRMLSKEFNKQISAGLRDMRAVLENVENIAA